MASQTTTSPRTRRALLGAGLGALAAAFAGVLGRAAPTRAFNGQTVTVGGDFTGTSATRISNTSSFGTAFRGSSASGIGVSGSSSTATGVSGFSSSGNGVFGFSNSGSTGVYGQSYAFDNAATIGHSGNNSTGLLGFSGPAIGTGSEPPPAKSKTGVFGYAAQDGTSKGVWGKSPAGHGVHGQSGSGWAGFFDGRVLTNKYHELVEIGTPPAPPANHARLFVRDNGSGKTQLCVRFPSGAVRVLATQA